MLGLVSQERLILNCLIFLTKQSFIQSNDLSQPNFSPPISFQFAFVARDCAVLRASIWSNRINFYAVSMLHGQPSRLSNIRSADRKIKHCENVATPY